MEQQVKERLTGGVILVVLLVLLVPELLTGPRAVPPPSAAQPDQAPMRSYTMDLGESPHAREPVAASTAVPPAGERAASSAAPARPPAAAPVDSAPTIPTAPAAPAVRTALPVRPLAAPAPRTLEPPSVSRPEHLNAAWTVQLGTFGKRENAARLEARLKAHGFSASIVESTHKGHKLFRVRVGGERDRAAAQKLLGRLRATGEKGGEIVAR